MSEEATKSVVIEFSARNLVKVTADEVDDSITHIGINIRGVAMDFQRAGYSLNELNRLMFNNSQIGRDVAGVFQGIGASLRIITMVQDFAKAVGLLNTVEGVSATTTAAADAARSASLGSYVASTLAAWGHAAAVQASNIAQAIASALTGPYGWAILAGAAIAAATALAWITGAIPSKQYGGPVLETGPYLLHAGEYVTPSAASTSAGGGTTIINAPINDPVFRNRSDMDYLINRLKRMGQA